SELADLAIRHVGNDDILPNGQPYLAAAVVLGQIRRPQHLLRGHAPYGHRKTDIVQSRLLLPEDADMVGVFRCPNVDTRVQERPVRAALQLAAKFLDAPIFDQECQASLSPRFTE